MPEEAPRKKEEYAEVGDFTGVTGEDRYGKFGYLVDMEGRIVENGTYYVDSNNPRWQRFLRNEPEKAEEILAEVRRRKAKK